MIIPPSCSFVDDFSHFSGIWHVKPYIVSSWLSYSSFGSGVSINGISFEVSSSSGFSVGVAVGSDFLVRAGVSVSSTDTDDSYKSETELVTLSFSDPTPPVASLDPHPEIINNETTIMIVIMQDILGRFFTALFLLVLLRTSD